MRRRVRLNPVIEASAIRAAMPSHHFESSDTTVANPRRAVSSNQASRSSKPRAARSRRSKRRCALVLPPEALPKAGSMPSAGTPESSAVTQSGSSSVAVKNTSPSRSQSPFNANACTQGFGLNAQVQYSACFSRSTATPWLTPSRTGISAKIIFSKMPRRGKNSGWASRVARVGVSVFLSVFSTPARFAGAYFPIEIKFAKSRYAPGTPAGSSRKNESPV